jgi:hypothetical protein
MNLNDLFNKLDSEALEAVKKDLVDKIHDKLLSEPELQEKIKNAINNDGKPEDGKATE